MPLDAKVSPRLFTALVLLLGAGCASTGSGDRGATISGRAGAITLHFPPGTPPAVEQRNFPLRQEYVTIVGNLGERLTLTVAMGPDKLDLSRDVQAMIDESIASMREIYEDPKMRCVGRANVEDTSVPVFEIMDGTGNDELQTSIPTRNGHITLVLTADGDNDISRHAPFFLSLLDTASIRGVGRAAATTNESDSTR